MKHYNQIKYFVKSLKLFGKSVKKIKNPNQLDMFITLGTEREFKPGDKRKLGIGKTGKKRWIDADVKKKKAKQSTPKILYHGTASPDFDEFDISRAGSIKYSDWGKGIYLISSKSGADYYRREAVKQTDKKYHELYKKYTDITNNLPPRSDVDSTPKYNEASNKALREFQEYARTFDNTDKGRVIEIELSPKAKIYRHNSSGGMTDPYLADYAKEKGYDVLLIDEGKYMEEYVIINPKVIKIRKPPDTKDYEAHLKSIVGKIKKWYRGVNVKNEGKVDRFYSASKEVASNYSMHKNSDERKYETFDAASNGMPKNAMIIGSKDELAVKIGFAEDPYSMRKFDDIAKKYAKKKGHDAIIYISGTFEEPELHLFGPEKRGNKSMKINLAKAFGQQIGLFQNQSSAYQKEGQTKEGKGGTLQLKRDSKGKGAHWRLMDKKQAQQKAGGQVEEPQNQFLGSKIINAQKAYNLLSDKLGAKINVSDKQGGSLGEGVLQLINENADGTTSLFVKDMNDTTSIVNFPQNQAVMQAGDSIQFRFADRDISVSLTERAEQKQERRINPETEKRKAEKIQEHNRLAENYIREANAQKDEYLQDLDEISKENGLEAMSHKYRNLAVKGKESILNKFERNEVKGKPEANLQLTDVLRGTIQIKNPNQYKSLMESFKERGYEIWNDDITNLYEDNKPGYKHIAVKLVKGKDDPVIKEIIFITPKMYEAKYGFGHDLYDLEKNIDIGLGKKVREGHRMYPMLMQFKQNVRRIANEFYMRAYYADQKLFSDSSSSASTEAPIAPPEAQTSKNSRRLSSGYSVPPKRLIRVLRSSLKAMLQPLSQSSINSSGDIFNLADSSAAIDSSLSSIVNPTKNIVKKYASNVMNLFKSKKSTNMKIFNKSLIFPKVEKVDIDKLEIQFKYNIPVESLPENWDIENHSAYPLRISFKNEDDTKFVQIYEDKEKFAVSNSTHGPDGKYFHKVDKFENYEDAVKCAMDCMKAKKSFLRNLFKAFGSQMDLFGTNQEELFTGQEKDGKKLLPSKSNPQKRRWQRTGEKKPVEQEPKKPDVSIPAPKKITAKTDDQTNKKKGPEVSKEEALAISKEIYNQIGHKALYMLGAQHIAYDKDGSLSFKIRGSRKFTHIKVSYDRGKDLYNLTFTKAKGDKISNEEKLEGIYNDQLHEIIEKKTELYTSLGTMGREKEDDYKLMSTEKKEAVLDKMNAKNENKIAELERDIRKRKMEINLHGGGMDANSDPKVMKMQKELDELKASSTVRDNEESYSGKLDLKKPVKFKNPQPGEEDMEFKVTNYNEVTNRVYIEPVKWNDYLKPQELVSVDDIENV